MDWWDYLDWRNNYKEMSYEDMMCELEFRAECQREDEQLKYLKEKENV